jgi:hypothetical protein
MRRSTVLRLVVAVGLVFAVTAATPAFAKPKPPGPPTTVATTPPTTAAPTTAPPTTAPPTTAAPTTGPQVSPPTSSSPSTESGPTSSGPDPKIAAQQLDENEVIDQDPPGNNGFVKVDDKDFDSIPNNVPHVGCVFRIDFYNFDEGDISATVTFTGVPPTGGGVLASAQVPIGGDPAGGGNDYDGGKTFDLSAALANITPHPQQGHHVHLDVEVPGPGGAKQKTFWVEGCSKPPPTTTTPPTTTPPTTAPPTTHPPTTHAPTTTPPTTEARSFSPATSPSTSPESSAQLARTGTDATAWIGMALALVVLGAVLTFAARKASARSS